MSGPLRRRESGERIRALPVNDWNRFVDTTNTVESLVGKTEPFPQSKAVREGLVKNWTPATWDNANNELTEGFVEIWPLNFDSVIDDAGTKKKKHTIDRSGDVVTIFHPYTHTVPAGANISWRGSKLVAGTCDAVSGWS